MVLWEAYGWDFWGTIIGETLEVSLWVRMLLLGRHLLAAWMLRKEPLMSICCGAPSAITNLPSTQQRRRKTRWISFILWRMEQLGDLSMTFNRDSYDEPSIPTTYMTQLGINANKQYMQVFLFHLYGTCSGVARVGGTKCGNSWCHPDGTHR